MQDPRLEIRHLKLLVALVEEGGVTKAGDVLHLTQSALSHQLRDAEERLGIRLFHRINKKMVITPAGRELVQASRNMLSELSRTEYQIRSFANGEAGLIRFSTQCYTCYGWLPKVIKEFRAKHSNVEVRIELGSTSDPVKDLQEGKLDLALAFDFQKTRFLRSDSLFKDEMVVIMPKDHPLAAKRYLKPKDFEGEGVLIYPPKEESTLLNGILQPHNVKPKHVYEVPLTEALVELVSEGMGMALVSGWAVAKHIGRGVVQARPLGRGGFHREWWAVTLKDLDKSYLQDFIRLVRAHHPSV